MAQTALLPQGHAETRAKLPGEARAADHGRSAAPGDDVDQDQVLTDGSRRAGKRATSDTRTLRQGGSRAETPDEMTTSVRRGQDPAAPRRAAAAQRNESQPGAGAERGGDMQVSVETFRQKLQPEGEFVQIRELGDAWKPRGIDAGWKPYTNGRWIFNEKVGWYFESDEPWAEITYHYGRWYEDPDQGWVWVADTEWAPAWVEWRRSKQYVGWRPLPPRNAPHRVSTRTTTTTTTTRRGGSSIEEEWVFVPSERITSERISTVVVDEPRITTIYEETRPVGRVETRGGIAVNFGIDPRAIERDTRVRIMSQNLPRAEAVPVPQQVRSISTEARATVNQGSGPSAGAEGTRGANTSAATTSGQTAAPAPSPTGAAPDSQAAGAAAPQGEAPKARSADTQPSQPSQPSQPKSVNGQAGVNQGPSTASSSAPAAQENPVRPKAVTAAPTPDASKPEAAKSEAVRSDVPKADAAKTDASKTEASKTEASKTEASKSEAPKADVSRSEPARSGTSTASRRDAGKPQPDAAAARSGAGEAAATDAGSGNRTRKPPQGTAPSAEPRPSGAAAGEGARREPPAQQARQRGAGETEDQTGTTRRPPAAVHDGARPPQEVGKTGAAPRRPVPGDAGDPAQ